MKILLVLTRVILSCCALVGGALLLGLMVFSLSMVIMRAPMAIGEKTDAIVVLTGGSGRVEAGLKAYHDGLSDRLLVSGVHKDVKIGEIVTLLPGLIVNMGGIVLDPRATSTAENALYSIEWIEEKKVRSIRLITAYYHMPRAYWEFKRRMPSLKIIPHAVNPETGPSYVKMLFAEYGKTVLTLLPTSPEN